MADEFIWKIKNGDLDEVKKIVEKGNCDLNALIQGGRAPLHFAADYGQTEVLEYLISKGADVNALDKHGISPLLSAIFEGHTASVKLLLSKGADKNGKAPSGDSFIDSAEKDEIKALLK